jgi:hypothetical protein
MTHRLTPADLERLQRKAFDGKTHQEVQTQKRSEIELTACFGKTGSERLDAIAQVVASNDPEWAKKLLGRLRNEDAAGALLDGFRGRFDEHTLIHAAIGFNGVGMAVLKRSEDLPFLRRLKTRVWISCLENDDPLYVAVKTKVEQLEAR